MDRGTVSAFPDLSDLRNTGIAFASMTKIILDTDIDTDCDDVGALATLHALVNRGEAEIVGIVCDIPNPSCAKCVQAINAWCGRPNLDVGLVAVKGWETSLRSETYRNTRQGFVDRRGSPLYVDLIAAEWEARLTSVSVHDAVQLYRTKLVGADDGSIVICAVGLLTALSELLKSGPDAISPLTGTELVEQKVKKLVTMALGAMPVGNDQWNWKMDSVAAEHVLSDWPTTIAVSQAGENITTGARLGKETPLGNPIRRAYEIWHSGEAGNRSSWDQVAVLYAVRGLNDCFEETGGQRIEYTAATGAHIWKSLEDGPEHLHLKLSITEEEMAARIEEFMVVAGKGSQVSHQ